MSSDTFIAYFGLRFEIDPDEVEGLELRADSRIKAARKVGLEYYWGNFGGPQERFLLFVGVQLAILGDENSEEAQFHLSEMTSLFDVTKKSLGRAGLLGEPALHLRWQPDI